MILSSPGTNVAGRLTNRFVFGSNTHSCCVIVSVDPTAQGGSAHGTTAAQDNHQRVHRQGSRTVRIGPLKNVFALGHLPVRFLHCLWATWFFRNWFSHWARV